MKLLFRTWNHYIPLAIISSKHKIGDIVVIRGQRYYINCDFKFKYYCVKSA